MSAGLLAAVAALGRPLLVGLDVDGTLSPIAPHPDVAVLVGDAAAEISRLGRVPGVSVVIVTGRGLRDVRDQFGLAADLRVIGSHGLEDSHQPMLALSDIEQTTASRLRAAAEEAAAAAPGAWVELKPAGVTLHVRQADAGTGVDALEMFDAAVVAMPGVWRKPSKAALEVTVRRASKGAALDVLRAELGGAAVFYAGDDITDEDVFRSLGPGDVGVKVGSGESAAAYRVPDPGALLPILAAIV